MRIEFSKYRLYEVFDQLNVFDSKFQKDNLEKLKDNIDQNNKNYDEILNRATNHIEDFLKKVSENKSMI